MRLGVDIAVAFLPDVLIDSWFLFEIHFVVGEGILGGCRFLGVALHNDESVRVSGKKIQRFSPPLHPTFSSSGWMEGSISIGWREWTEENIILEG